ncbi:hypothetical protein DF200_04425 [Bifidobacterium catulorum]|uniref:Uncharacterized protein n=1 Tax=Bifidobacterium catulorum TaxID=1630173 RepID=A0A2U2MT49_9BIFI|nr:hypothetical protein DF200_04425 [Bifidobacterium catulorum]
MWIISAIFSSEGIAIISFFHDDIVRMSNAARCTIRLSDFGIVEQCQWEQEIYDRLLFRWLLAEFAGVPVDE